MESRNLIFAIILSIGVLFIWSFFFEAPEQQNLDEFSLDEEVSEVNSDELDMEAIAEIEDSLGIDNGNTIDLSEALSKDQRVNICLLYTSPSPRDRTRSRMPSSA